jgi:hypothetical protein
MTRVSHEVGVTNFLDLAVHGNDQTREGAVGPLLFRGFFLGE